MQILDINETALDFVQSARPFAEVVDCRLKFHEYVRETVRRTEGVASYFQLGEGLRILNLLSIRGRLLRVGTIKYGNILYDE